MQSFGDRAFESKGTRCVYYGDRGKGDQIRITMFPQAKVATDKIPDLLAAYQGKLRFVPETTPYFVYQQKEEPLLRQLSELVNEMQKIKEEENE